MYRAAAALFIVLLCMFTGQQCLAATTAMLTGKDVRDKCNVLSTCKGQNAKIDTFCDLAKSTTPASSWEIAAVPTVDEFNKAACTGPSPLGAQPVPDYSQNAQGSSFLSQSSLVWGATEFLLNRATVELQDWAIDKFVGLVCDDGEYAKLDGQPLFPNSCRVLKTLSLNGFMPGLSALQSAMKLDLNHLPVLIVNHIRLIPSLNGTQKDVAGVAFLLAKIIEANLEGHSGIASLPAALKIDPGQLVSCKAAPATADAWELMNLIASLPGDDSAKTLPQDDSSWRFAVMAFGINVGDSNTDFGALWPADCRRVANNNGSQVNTFAFHPVVLLAGTAAVADDAKKIETALNNLKQVPVGADPSMKTELYAEILAAALDPLAKIITADDALRAEAGALGTAITTVDKMSGDYATGSYGALTVDVLQTVVVLGSNGGLPDYVTRLAAFGADVAQANTPDAVASAIDRAAAPVGSYKRKRLGGWYASLNAYVGLSIGAEYAKGPDNDWAKATWGFVPGFWVPVGFEFGGGSVGGGNLGILLQAVDLGVLASWRVNTSSDQLSAPPNVGIAQVVSPGGALVYGIPSAPLSVALHGEFEPSLRQVGQTGGFRDAFLFGASLAVDIPLFP